MEYGWGRGDVIVADGVEVARADRSWLRERAEVRVGAEQWTFEATGSWLTRRRLVGLLDGAELMAAEPRGFWQTSWEITAAGEELSLSPAGVLTSRMVLTRSGAEVGSVRASHLLTHRPELTSTVSLAPAVAAFVLWVAFVELTRRSARASSGST
jgi:hypothetical protein